MKIQKKNGSRPVSIMLQTVLLLTIMAADGRVSAVDEGTNLQTSKVGDIATKADPEILKEIFVGGRDAYKAKIAKEGSSVRSNETITDTFEQSHGNPTSFNQKLIRNQGSRPDFCNGAEASNILQNQEQINTFPRGGTGLGGSSENGGETEPAEFNHSFLAHFLKKDGLVDDGSADANNSDVETLDKAMKKNPREFINYFVDFIIRHINEGKKDLFKGGLYDFGEKVFSEHSNASDNSNAYMLRILTELVGKDGSLGYVDLSNVHYTDDMIFKVFDRSSDSNLKFKDNLTFEGFLTSLFKSKEDGGVTKYNISGKDESLLDLLWPIATEITNKCGIMVDENFKPNFDMGEDLAKKIVADMIERVKAEIQKTQLDSSDDNLTLQKTQLGLSDDNLTLLEKLEKLRPDLSVDRLIGSASDIFLDEQCFQRAIVGSARRIIYVEMRCVEINNNLKGEIQVSGYFGAELLEKLKKILQTSVEKLVSDTVTRSVQGDFSLKDLADNLNKVCTTDSVSSAVNRVLERVHVSDLHEKSFEGVFTDVWAEKIEKLDLADLIKKSYIKKLDNKPLNFLENTVCGYLGSCMEGLNNDKIGDEFFADLVQNAKHILSNSGNQQASYAAAPVIHHSNIYTNSTVNMSTDQFNAVLAKADKNPDAAQPQAQVDQQGGQQAAQPQAQVDQQGGQQAAPKKTISEVFAEVKAVYPLIKNKGSLNLYNRLNGFLKKAGIKAGMNVAKRVKSASEFASKNPNWLAALRVWNDYLVQQVADLKGQKPTPKTKKAITKAITNLNNMIKLAKPVLDKMGNVPVVAEPKEVNGVALPAKLTRKQILDAKKKARLEAILAKKEQKRLKEANAKKQKQANAAEKAAGIKAPVPVVVAGKAQTTSTGAA